MENHILTNQHHQNEVILIIVNEAPAKQRNKCEPRLAVINSGRPQQAGRMSASIFNETHRRAQSSLTKSRMNEAFFQFFRV